MLAVRQFLEHHWFADALLRKFDELKAHDALVGGQGWHRFADVMAVGTINVGLELLADRIEVQCQQYLKGLEQGQGRVIEIVAKCRLGRVIDPVIEDQ